MVSKSTRFALWNVCIGSIMGFQRHWDTVSGSIASEIHDKTYEDFSDVYESSAISNFCGVPEGVDLPVDNEIETQSH